MQKMFHELGRDNETMPLHKAIPELTFHRLSVEEQIAHPLPLSPA